MTTGYKSSKSLEDALDFSTSDLAANREGRLTAHQIERLRAEGHAFRRLLLIIGVFAVVVAAPLLAFAGDSPEAPMLFLLLMIVPGGLGALFAARLRGIQTAVGAGRVLAVEGLAETQTKVAMRGGAAYYVRIGEVEFFITRDLQQAFESGKPYRVFYTPKRRIIVSGEFAPMPDSVTRASRLVTPKLANAIGFSREDLEANRAGRLSPVQVAVLSKSRNHHLLLALVGLPVAVAIAHFWPVLAERFWAILFWGAFDLIAAALVVVSLWGAWCRAQDARGGEIAVTRGLLQRHTDETNGSARRQPSYKVVVAGVQLQVPLKVFGAFADGGHYALYYAPRSRVLLAAEPLDAPEPETAVVTGAFARV